MHKALRCTCSQNPPLLSPSFLISFDITQSLLLDLCICNLLSSLLIGVEFFVPQFICIMSQIIFLWCITPDYSCLVDGSVDLGSVVASFFQHFSCPGSFLFLPSPSHSHVCYLWLIVMSIFIHFCYTLTLLIDLSQTNLLFPFSSAL